MRSLLSSRSQRSSQVNGAGAPSSPATSFATREQRLLDAIRLTVAVVGWLLHLVLGVVYWWLGQIPWVWANVGSLVVWGVGALLVLRGRSLPAFWVCFLEGMAHMCVACVLLGLGSGYLSVLVSLSAAPLIVFSRREHRHFVAAAAVVTVTAATSFVLSLWLEPSHSLPPVGLEVLLYINTGAGVMMVVAVGAFARMMDRVIDDEIAGLRHQVREAMQPVSTPSSASWAREAWASCTRLATRCSAVPPR